MVFATRRAAATKTTRRAAAHRVELSNPSLETARVSEDDPGIPGLVAGSARGKHLIRIRAYNLDQKNHPVRMKAVQLMTARPIQSVIRIPIGHGVF